MLMPLEFPAEVITTSVALQHRSHALCTRAARLTHATRALRTASAVIRRSTRAPWIGGGNDDPVLGAGQQHTIRRKVELGWLPREPANVSVAAAGTGRPCDGCEQSITADVMILATFRNGTILRFHRECFSAWETARAVSTMSPEDDGSLTNRTVDGVESPDDTGLTPGYAMSRVLITCPSTNLPVPTGLSMDLEAFSMGAFDERFVDCPHCQLIHAWATDDAYLEDADDPAEDTYPETTVRRCPVCASPDIKVNGTASQDRTGGPIKLGYACQNTRCRSQFFLV
jgi:hypothetical protein